MRVRFAIDTSCLPQKYLGGLGVGCGLAVFLVLRAPLPALALVVVGLLACRSRSCFILHPPDAVLAQIEKTLALLALSYHRERHRLLIPVTRTTVHVRALGPATYLSFILGDRRSIKEIYLASTLLKYLKYQKYRTQSQPALGR